LEARRTCFVVSAFGATAEEQRAYKQVLRHLVQGVLEPDYEVIRADQIDEEGLITNQIIEHLLEDDLVVADLTGLNPNVFYEIAVRHAARKPIVHLITKGQEIPFDVANVRAVPYALDDPDLLEEARDELGRKVKAIEGNDFKAAPNPISAARDVWLLRESEQPAVREAGDLLGALNDLRDEVRGLSRRVDGAADGRKSSIPLREVRSVLSRHGPMRAASIAELLQVSTPMARSALQGLGRKGEATRLASGAWTLDVTEADA
jgi:hypothetical protein